MATGAASEPEIGHSSSRHNHGHDAPHADEPKAKKRVPDDNIARLVAEENASRSKFPRYPGLERWELVEKMGDGAFSNVYRARDLEGNAGEVAIKVVRKYEMNSQQVRGFAALPFAVIPLFLGRCRQFAFWSKFLYQH